MIKRKLQGESLWRRGRLMILMLAILAVMIFVVSGCSDDDDSPTGSNGTTPSDTVFYANVSGIFSANCTSVNCHGGASPQEGLLLTSYANIIAGSNGGPVVVAGNSGASELYLRITGASTPSMPFNGSLLSLTSRNLVRDWIDDGALE